MGEVDASTNRLELCPSPISTMPGEAAAFPVLPGRDRSSSVGVGPLRPSEVSISASEPVSDSCGKCTYSGASGDSCLGLSAPSMKSVRRLMGLALLPSSCVTSSSFSVGEGGGEGDIQCAMVSRG